MTYIRRKRDLILHMIMAFVGGATGVYAVMMRGNFGQAQTVNLLDLFVHWVKMDSAAEVLYRFAAFGLFLLALGLAHHMRRYIRKETTEITCLCVEAGCACIAGLIPETAPDIPALYPIFFMTGFQWGNFSGADGFNCSTIFCTNNSRQALFGWMDYIHDRDRHGFEQGRFYTATICFFYSGAVIFALLSLHFAIRAIWFAWVPIGAAVLVWMLAQDSLHEEQTAMHKIA